ncbi:MAG: TrmH family RNA methyltransferase, partial [Cyanobacteriota bacterium]|nr:TrmH family RNA methyltransferase [Cyanobacteriota bacterium]
AGAILHLPHQRFGSSGQGAVEQLAEQLECAARRGLQVVATMVPGSSAAHSCLPYWQLDWRKPTVLVLGNEGSGLHPRLQACCTACVTLPHSAAVESLNVAAVAVPLLLERRRATMTSSTQ